MFIEIDNGSGFCFGVTTAISKAEEELNNTGHLYCLGDIVHNSNEVERLKHKGLETITHDQLKQLARRNNIEIIDATCPVVLQLQRRINKCYNSVEQPPQIVIYGKRGHAEVNGLVGQTQGNALVIESLEEIDKIDFSRDIYLYSQTTKSLQGFKAIVEEIGNRIEPGVQFKSYDTICRSVANRIPQIRQFAKRHELILFVCGSKSSNGKILFAECLDANGNSHMISNKSEIDTAWLEGKHRWLMNQVKNYIEQHITT